MKTLLLIPGRANEPQTTLGPVPWASALSDALQYRAGEEVTVLSHTDAARDQTPAVRLAGRIGGPDAALAMMGFLRRRGFDVIFTGSEEIGGALALLSHGRRRRPAHVSLGHRLSGGGLRRRLKNLNLKHAVEVLFLYAQAQRDFAEDHMGIATEKLLLVSPCVDDHFFRPRLDAVVRADQVCAAGVQWRDYPTLLDAAAAMPDLNVRVATYPAPMRLQDLPDHIPLAPICDFEALRTLYAESSFVVVPLRDTDFAAGATTILQAMAMGKAVIATRTEGQADVIIEGVTGLSVAPGDVVGWRQAITQLRHDAVLRERLGRNARRWVEEHAALDRWAARIADGVRAAADLGADPVREADGLPTVIHGVW